MVLGRLSRHFVLFLRHMLCVAATAMVCTAATAQEGLPDPQTSTEAARQVMGWIADWHVDDAGPKLEGASVCIRLDGKVIGRSEAYGGTSDPLGEATRAAMLRAGSNLPADWDVRSEAARSRLMIEVELAGPLVPLEGASDAELTLGVSPGLDGVAVRVGDRVAARFPLQMLPARESSAQAIRSLVAELSEDPGRGLSEIRELRELGYVFYRFRTVQMAQLDPRATPVFLHRGGRVIEPGEINTPSLHAMADGLADHLIHRRWPGIEPFGLMGTIDPVTGRVEARAEHPATQALVISALSTYARLDGGDTDTRQRARSAIGELVRELSDVAEDEAAPWDDAGGAAAVIVALGDARGYYNADDEKIGAMSDKCHQRLLEAIDRRRGGFAAVTPEGAWGVVALATVRLALAGDPNVSKALADGVVRTAFRDTPGPMLVSQFPWLGWADMELAGVSEPIKATTAMLEVRRQINEHQLDVTTLSPADRDLAGSVVFSTGGSPLPNWNSIRPLPLLADMLADARLTSGTLREGEAAEEIGHLLSLVRFARQLASDRSDAHMYLRPERAMWGVRMALWDPRMPLESSALALDGVCRTLRAVHTIASRSDEPSNAESQRE